jgi:apolipoprotein N-acyltransferase
MSLRPWILTVVGGVLLPISFAGFDQWYLTWIAFVPLLGAIEGSTRRQAFWLGWGYGVIANLIGYYWIPSTIHVFGGFPLVLAWLFNLIMCAYQGLQYALLAYFTNRLQERGHSLLWVFPAVMVALESIYPLLFPIFMGNTQHPIPLLIQASDLLGPLLITAVILTFNASLYLALRARWRGEPWPRLSAVGPVGLIALVVYGAIRMPMVESAVDQGTPLKVGVVQGNMGIAQKWRDVEEGLRRHEEGSLELERQGADLIVWSEAAYTAGYINPRRRNLRQLMVPELTTPLLAGALVVRGRGEQRTRHNSAIMLDEAGNVEGIYDKTYLLAFGEFLPFGDVFPELHAYSPNSGRLKPGRRLVGLPLDHHGRRWNLGVMICYEDILPRFTRALVKEADPHLLINMTNDAWFGDTNEPWIHLALAKFRAVEHRRYLVRATNTGVSAVIDPWGRVTSHSSVFTTENMLSDVRLLEGGTTLYALVGDLLGWLAVALLGWGAWRTRRIWLRRPQGLGRQGLTQAAGILLAVGIVDALVLLALCVLRPAGWLPPPLLFFLWLVAALALVVGAVGLRRGRQRALVVAAMGISSQVLATLYIAATLSPERLAATAQLVGVPLGCCLLAGLNLWLWRSRRSINN